MTRSGKRFTLKLFLLVMFPIVAIASARADVSLYDDGILNIDFGLTVGGGLFKTRNTNFGAGLDEPGKGTVADVDWREAFALPKLTAEFASPGMGSFYGGLGYVFAATRGVGTPDGLTFNRPDAIDNEFAYGGWKSGGLTPSLGTDVVDISWGRQGFEVGDGFLIADGNSERFRKATLYLGPRTSFERAGLLRINTRPVRFDAFYLESDHDFDDPHLFGGNAELINETYGTLGVYGFRIFDADPATTRDGLRVVSVRGEGNPLAYFGVENSHFAFEYADQHNGETSRQADARGWHATAGYTFSDLPWMPDITYRFSHFSGDDPNTSENETFDPLFVAGPGVGTWFQGEITGQYLLANANLDVHMVALSATPTEGLNLGLQFFNFTLDEPGAQTPATGFSAVSSDDFGDEINVFAEISAFDHLTVMPLYGVVLPGEAAQQMNGRHENYHLFELILTLEY